MSFRADMRDDYGGNGNQNSVYAGTIDRTSGRVLGVRDFVPKGKWPALRQKLHFIYNPYEIACGAADDIDAVVDPKTL